jgi:gamma-glutamyltranspeptidase
VKHGTRIGVMALAGALAGAALDLRSAGLPPGDRMADGRAPTQSPAAHGPSGVREASWSPDGKRLAVSWFDEIWTMSPDGRDQKRVVSGTNDWIAQRDPAWSPDGRQIAFSVNTTGQFDVWIAPANGGAARKVTSMDGDERWPSWTPDNRLVFSHRPPRGAWRLYTTSGVARAAEPPGATPQVLSPDGASEWQGRVSPDGKRIAFISDRDLTANDDSDVWVREFSEPGPAATPPAIRVTNTSGVESHPAWAPDNARVAYFAMRTGPGASVWVSTVPDAAPADAPAGGRAGRGGGRGGGRGRGGSAGGDASNAAPGALVLASRHGGVPAWSPDGETLVIATFPVASAGYNGNPNRNDDDPPIALADADQYEFWRVAAPRPVDADAESMRLPDAAPARWARAFDQVWQTVKSLYYQSGASADAWDALRDKYRPQLRDAREATAVEDVVDRMLAEQPLMKPAIESPRAVVASGHPLASAAGALVLEKGGNVVDAGIAVSFALGVVEPDASGLGGDGQAILFLRGMSQPVVVEYKDMTPSRISTDNPRLFTPAGARIATDGPSAANIPGVVAGLDLLYQKYGSKKVAWADLIAPAVALADEGFVLDEALPTTIAEGRAAFARYPEAARIFLPNGRVPRPGERFVNKDYAETLRVLAKEGGQSFYRGTIARRIVDDMAANGGIIAADDLAQYRAMERQPLVARYRDHLVYAPGPPVSTGLQLLETLQILENYQPKAGATYTTDPDYLHHVIDAWRVRDGGARMADPERWPADLGNHLESGHTRERFKLIDPKKAYVSQGGGRGGGPVLPSYVAPSFSSADVDWSTPPSRAGNAADPVLHIETGTTAFVVADAEGNMIAFTQTLSTWGGNFYVSKGLGFLYNDHFRGGGGGGRGGGGYGSTLPLMRSSTTSVPTLVFAPMPVDPGRYGIPGYAPRLAAGAAGNAWIPASVYNIILNVVDGGMSAQRAIEAPRMLIGGGEGGRSRVQIEDRIPRTLLAELEARGHTFAKVGRKGEVKYGYAAVAVVNAAKGTVEGGAEPRRSHGTAAPGR